mmetsp:Transcript_3417/g.5202  ORF Transcript_3417/g.5202 Transcript_3417/m.5202 type:complete len:294 (-) Transcript_3417:95-976(-)
MRISFLRLPGQIRLGLLFLCLSSILTLVHSNAETLIAIAGKDFVLIGADSSVSGGGISWRASGLDKISILQPTETNPQNIILAATIGPTADTDRLTTILKEHCAIRQWEAGVGPDVEYVLASYKETTCNKFTMPSKGLTADAVAHLARFEIWKSLRSEGRLNVCLFIAGMNCLDEANTMDFPAKRVQHQVQQATNSVEKISQNRDSTRGLRPCLFWIDSYGSLQRLDYGAHGHAANFCLSILDQGYRTDISKDEAILLLQSCFDQLRVRYIIHDPLPPCIKCIDKDGCQLISG